jgi:DNA-binding HxlR family transcriptional regulator
LTDVDVLKLLKEYPYPHGLKFKELSKLTGIPATTLFETLKKLEKEGLVWHKEPFWYPGKPQEKSESNLSKLTKEERQYFNYLVDLVSKTKWLAKQWKALKPVYEANKEVLETFKKEHGL